MKSQAVHQFKPGAPFVERNHGAVVREIRGRGVKVWGAILGVAQHHGFLPRHIFDSEPSVIDARNEAMEALDNMGVDREDIARWWRTSVLHVRSGIAAHRRAYGYDNGREPSETKPGLIRGHGEKRDDCTGYESCLAAYAKKSGFHARCPDACSGYLQIKRRATDYLRQREAPSVCAQATPKGHGI